MWELPPRLKCRKFFKKRNETKSVGTTANLEFYVEVLKCGNSSILLETSKGLCFWDKLLVKCVRFIPILT
ncbi:hypothetical protein B1J94_03075 [Leptospira kirschneri serovar Grippotyphosa]|nr:hypothetical protein B1J94_03075 [Leptospira kirschneri serovar Grippotyphosa]